MRFLEVHEIWEWCAALQIRLDRDERPAIDPALSHRERQLYADGKRSGREGVCARVAVQQLGAWDQCLLWITQTGVWPSSEDWPAYYAMRGQFGEKRSVDVAPGHLFDASERDQFLQFLTVAMENGWDAFALTAAGGRRGEARAEISHDEWIEVQSAQPVSANQPAV